MQALTSDTVRLGSLDPVRDLTFVADTVDGFLRLAGSRKAVGRTVNTGTGHGITIGELAETIIALVNPDAQIACEKGRVRPEKSEVMKLVCDNTLVHELTGWRPRHTLHEGLSLTIDWMKEHIGAYKTGIYTI
jgi:dTDP-glucose 4,6-dehydratase